MKKKKRQFKKTQNKTPVFKWKWQSPLRLSLFSKEGDNLVVEHRQKSYLLPALTKLLFEFGQVTLTPCFPTFAVKNSPVACHAVKLEV